MKSEMTESTDIISCSFMPKNVHQRSKAQKDRVKNNEQKQLFFGSSFENEKGSALQNLGNRLHYFACFEFYSKWLIFLTNFIF